MAIIPYYNNTSPEAVAVVNAGILDAYSEAMAGRNLLTALGDYWFEYFGDLELLQANFSGVNALLSTQYVTLLNQVLSSNIINIPTEQPFAYDLIVFDSRKAFYVLEEDGQTLAYLSYPLPQGLSVDFLLSSLFEPGIVLQQGIHYVVADNELRFYVDIFRDTAILDGVYNTSTVEASYILFWAANLLLQETYIYERFGVFLYNKEYDSETYKMITTALQYFYTQTKSVKNIEAITNILYGLPYSRFDNEVIIKILELEQEAVVSNDPDYDPVRSTPAYQITTNRAVYQVRRYSTLLVEEGSYSSSSNYLLVGTV